MMDWDFETDRVVAEIISAKAARVGLQFPEGLKDKAVDIAAEIEDKTSATVIILTDPTYGACDMKEAQTASLGIDLLIHYGHTDKKPVF